MSKTKNLYQCQQCGETQSKWSGQCNACGQWNTLEEILAAPSLSTRQNKSGYAGETSKVTKLSDVSVAKIPRVPSGLSELDRALGGGIVTGSVTLIGGDPGIGKSTLLLQTLSHISSNRCLYVSGEESAQQIKLRAQRLGLSPEHLDLCTETSVENIISTALSHKPDLLVVDSIQTIYSLQFQSAPGSVTQVRESSAQLVRLAKQHNIALFLVGHVTKDGALAGPKVLEHMVDTVLYFEGDPSGRYRILRAIKNRFGAVNELGIFAMTEEGLKGVTNPSAIFLSRHENPVPGSIIMVTREGTRPLMVEIQALVSESFSGTPKRLTVGLEQNRLNMLLAVLSRHGGIMIQDQDVYINAVGGVKISETAADLPILLATLSSFRDKPLPAHTVAMGEVGLAGEIRPIPNGEDRIREAVKHGYKRAIVPKANLSKSSKKLMSDIQIIPVSTIQEIINHDLLD